jgi:DNA polymerase III delta' subunit
MDGARTRGHPAALAAIGSMIRRSAPGAVLVVGPAGVGKTTLASDLAAGLLCTAEDVAARPCGVCRSCRLVARGVHPDVHRLGPDGPGRQVVIGGPGAKVRGIRDLIGELALLPVEGGARVAIVESAQRMNEDAQAALLKTLEEPPAGTTIVLCADAEEPLLPTIRSRCARIRLGPVSVREIEAILADVGAADPPVAARAARIAGGRPGIALAWVARPDALRERDVIGRTLLDLAIARPADRLAGIRALAAQAAAIIGIGEGARSTPTGLEETGAAASKSGRRGRRGAAASSVRDPSTNGAPAEDRSADDASTDDAAADGADDTGQIRAPAAERRRAAEALIALWTDVARDLALCQRGLDRSVRDLALLDDTKALAMRLDPDEIGRFIERSGRASVLISGNASPELVLDDLALAWPRPHPSSHAA